jgi:hypothetical protein
VFCSLSIFDQRKLNTETLTLLMILALVAMLFCPGVNPTKELLSLYCTTCGAVVT